MSDLTGVVGDEPVVELGNGISQPIADAVGERQKGLESIAGVVNDNGDVDVDQLSGADPDPLLILADEDQGLPNPVEEAASMIMKDTTTSITEKAAQLARLHEGVQESTRTDVRAREVLIAADAEKAPTVGQRLRAEIVGQALQEENSLARRYQEIGEVIEGTFDEDGLPERFYEFAESELVLWAKSGHWDPARFLTDVFDVDLSVGDYVIGGDILDQARANWKTYDNAEQLRRLDLAEQMLFARQGTLGTDNKFEANRLYTILGGVVGDAKAYGAANALTFWEPIINLGTLGIGGAVIKTGKKLLKPRPNVTGMAKGSVAKEIATTAPQSGKGILRAAVEDATGETAESLGVKRANIVDDVIAPLAPGDSIKRGPDLSGRASVEPVDEVAQDIIKLRGQSVAASDVELADAADALGAKLNKLVAKGRIQVSKTDLWTAEDGTLRATYRMGDPDTSEFSTFREAQEFIGKNLEAYQLDSTRVLQYNAKTDDYQPVTKLRDIDAPGGYLVEAEYRATLNTVAKPENLFRGENINLLTNNLDSAAVFVDRIADSITELDLTRAAINAKLKKVLTPIRKLGRKDQLRVWEVATQGEKNFVNHTDDELVKMFKGNQKMIDGYKAIRRTYHIEYVVRNQAIRDHLQSGGYRELRTSVDASTYMRPVRGDRPSIAYDPVKKEMRAIGDEEDVWETFSPIKHTNEAGLESAAKHVVITPDHLRPLGPTVIPEVPGYLGRTLKAQWLVRKVTKGPNGEDVESVVRFGDNPANLKIWAARQGDPELTVSPSREVGTGGGTIDGEAELMADLGMLGHAKHRQDLNQMDDSYSEVLMDPEHALSQAVTTMSQQGAVQEWTKYMVKKWNDTYGDLTIDGQMNWKSNDNFKPDRQLTTEQRELITSAKALRGRILITTGMDPKFLRTKQKEMMVRTADYFSNLAADVSKKDPRSRIAKTKAGILGKTSELASKGADKSPIDAAKNLNHLQFISFHPLRQLVLQGSSALAYVGVRHGPAYAASGRYGADFAFLAAMKGFDDMSEEAAEVAIKAHAKLTGGSTAASRQFYKEFDDSGLLQSVGGHQYQEFASDAILGATARPRTVKQLADKGFQTGENINMQAAYLMVRNRFMKERNVSVLSSEEARKIAIEAKQLSGNMGSFNKSAFQQGLAGVPFQFMSHNVKMLQLMVPQTKWTKGLSIPVLSNREKAQVGTAYALLWGSGGYGVTNIINQLTDDEGIVQDAAVQNAIEEGIAGMAIETAFEALGGDDGQIDVSQSFGAFSGLAGSAKLGDGEAATPIGLVAEWIHTALSGNVLDAKEFFGASGRLIDDPTGMFNRAMNLWSSPSFSVGEKGVIQAKRLATFFPAINEAFQARAAANIGQWTNKQGDPIAEAAFSEALAKGILGLEPTRKGDTYDLQTMMNGRSAVMDEPDHNELRRSGKDLADVIMSGVRELNNGTVTRQELYDRTEVAMAMAKQAYPDKVDFLLVTRTMKKKLTDDFKKQQGKTLEEGLFQKLITDKELQQEMSYDTMINTLKGMPPSEHRDWAIDNIGKWFRAGRYTGTDKDRSQE